MILVILFNAEGYFIVYELNQCLLKKEMLSLLEHGCFSRSITLISIYDPAHDPSFKRTQAREIEYHGNMYDVARESRSGNITTFFCIHDKQEDQLIAGIKSVEKMKNVLSLLQHRVTIALPVITLPTFSLELRKIAYPNLTELLQTRSIIPFNPPPELG